MKTPSRVLASGWRTRLTCAQLPLFLLIFAAGCVFRPAAMPVLSVGQSRSVGRLMGVNHLFTIGGYFSRPEGIATDIEGNLYVADSRRHVICVLNRDGRLLDSIGRAGWRIGEFDKPTSIAIDAQSIIYIADSGNNRIQKLSLINRRFSIIAGERPGEAGEPVSLSQPQSVASDTRGYIYIADTWNHRVLKLDRLGRIQMEIGGLGWTGQQFRSPQGLSVDTRGNIYVSDTGNNRVHKLDFSGSLLAIWGEEGKGEGQFRGPAGQAIDRFGNVYVADRGNHRIQIFDSEGRYLMEFGYQALDDPVDVAVDGELHAYVADAGAGDVEVFRVIYEVAEDTR